MGRPLFPHGSSARYRWHLRRGEKACGPCLAAKRADWKGMEWLHAHLTASRDVVLSGGAS